MTPPRLNTGIPPHRAAPMATPSGWPQPGAVAGYVSLGDYLRDVRALKALGLPKIASVTGFHTSNLSRVERTVHRPTPDTLRQLSHPLAYGCPWWSSGQNQVFLLALAYHLTRSPHYAPRQLEWLPADMAVAEAVASIVFRRADWAMVDAWPDLVESWTALSLPGWRPPAAPTPAAPPPHTRPLWLWGAWSVVHHDQRREAFQRMDQDPAGTLATLVTALADQAADRLRTQPAPQPEPPFPDDAEFQAIVATWPRLDMARRQFARQMVEALAALRPTEH